jgi:hypothetical protein
MRFEIINLQCKSPIAWMPIAHTRKNEEEEEEMNSKAQRRATPQSLI